MECFACWPFGTKGHYHLPSAFSPILADALVRSRFLGNKNSDLVLIHDSWNVQGRYTDYQAITEEYKDLSSFYMFPIQQ